MTIIESILTGKPIEYAIDKAAVEQEIKQDQPSVDLLGFLEVAGNQRYGQQPNHQISATSSHQDTSANVLGPSDRVRDSSPNG